MMRAAVIGACLGLSACATAPKMSTEELDRQLNARLVEIRTVDARLVAFQAASKNAPGASAPSTQVAAYYNSAGIKIQPIDPRSTQWVRDSLGTTLEKRGATRFEYRNGKGEVAFQPPWSSQKFDGVPLEVQFAAGYAGGTQLRGAESDVRVPLAAGSARMITIWNDPGDRVSAADTLSSLPPVGASAPQPEQLRARYGVGPIEGWSPSELASLEEALALLGPKELAAIAGLPFRRDDEPDGDLPVPKIPEDLIGAGATHCGLFVYKDNRRWIEVYDCAFATDELQFVGEPDRPVRASSRAILHEIG